MPEKQEAIIDLAMLWNPRWNVTLDKFGFKPPTSIAFHTGNRVSYGNKVLSRSTNTLWTLSRFTVLCPSISD
jgi:hypothetical protein